jgi:hypothetical protein
MRSVSWLEALGVLAATLVLSGCPGEKSDPQPQSAAPRVESTGVVTDGVNLGQQFIVAKGEKGLARETNTDSQGAFALNMSELSAPYLFSNTVSPGADPSLVALTSVNTRIGPTNVTPLTTLLTAQLFGVTPATVYQTFDTTLDRSGISEDAIRIAQADLTAYLQEVVGIQVKSGIGSFIDSSFKTNVGDPMYDTILALNEKIAADGTTLKALGEKVALGAQACLTEKIQVSIGGQQKKFCPIAKSDVPEEADTAILDYKFRDISNALLLVKVRDDTVLSVDFTTAAGVTYSCSGAACAGVSLGAQAADESRPIVFGSLALTGSGGGALLDGTLVGPPPSIELPVLPCTDNRYFVIFSNHSVLGDCIRSNDPFQYGASIGSAGPHGQVGIRFDGQGSDTGAIEIKVDRTTHAPIYVYFSKRNPDTGVLERFLCQLAACNGVTWGEGRPDNSRGFPVELRTITLDNTLLAGVDDNGNPTGASAVVRLSGLGLFDPNSADPPAPQYPTLADCDPAADTVSVLGPTGEFNICLPQNDAANGAFWRVLYDDGAGNIQLNFSNLEGDQVVVDLANGALTDAYVFLNSTFEYFNCTADCAGVGVSGPDVNGEYTVSFANTVLHIVNNNPAGPPIPDNRTLTLTSGDLIMPPP